MSEISDAIQAKCLAFGDRIIKLNDYLLKEAANKKPSFKMVKGKRVYEKSVPVYLQSVSNLCNQLLRAGTSIGAKQLLEQWRQSEACFNYAESWQKSTKLMQKHVMPSVKQTLRAKASWLWKKPESPYTG